MARAHISLVTWRYRAADNSRWHAHRALINILYVMRARCMYALDSCPAFTRIILGVNNNNRVDAVVKPRGDDVCRERSSIYSSEMSANRSV